MFVELLDSVVFTQLQAILFRICSGTSTRELLPNALPVVVVVTVVFPIEAPIKMAIAVSTVVVVGMGRVIRGAGCFGCSGFVTFCIGTGLGLFSRLSLELLLVLGLLLLLELTLLRFFLFLLGEGLREELESRFFFVTLFLVGGLLR